MGSRLPGPQSDLSGTHLRRLDRDLQPDAALALLGKHPEVGLDGVREMLIEQTGTGRDR